jgi:UDP-N-acetylglucosamine 2-epimerase (non-hydrolysing)
MIVVAYGTTAELIKLAPVLRRLQDRQAPVLTLCTGQHVEQIPALLDDLELAHPYIWLARGNNGRDLERRRDLPEWLFQVTKGFARARGDLLARFASDSSSPLLLVHGDTMTTVLGALMGRLMRVPVAHVEAGIRSGDWRNPFPEELDRIAAARLARIHYAPGPHAAANLRSMNARGEIVDTGGNTICDSLDMVPPVAHAVDLPQEPFGIVSLHRSELLGSRSAFAAILGALQEASRSAPLVFIDHPVTAAAISAHKLESLFDTRFRRIPRQRYFRFIALQKASAFVVTDSGGSQEECAQAGHPCLVHRAVTERPDGLDGGSVVLSRMSLDVVRAFLEDPSAYRTAPAKDRVRPSDAILAHLELSGYLRPLSVVAKPTALAG